MVAVACLLSCRSVKNEGSVDMHHYSNGADTIAAVSQSERIDSTSYYHGVIDSLSRELLNVRQKYRDLYVRDSIITNLYRADSVSVRDSTWMQFNADGSVTYHHDREKHTYSYQQLESYRQQIVRESQATIDSLTERNTYLQAQYDSIYRLKSLADSLSIYRSRLDSISDIVREKEKTTIRKNSFWDSVKLVTGTLVFCVIVFAVLFVYLRFFRR